MTEVGRTAKESQDAWVQKVILGMWVLGEVIGYQGDLFVGFFS